MKYYKVIKEKYDYLTGNTAIENELLTEKERNKKFKLADKFFKEVNIFKNNTFWSFGCRFEMTD